MISVLDRCVLYYFLLVMLSAGVAVPVIAQQSVSFDNEIAPILTRYGCNAGSCHGAAIGRGGFKLSLFGSDLQSDYEALVHQLEGRRINRVDPSWSLLLRKATETVEHEGGLRFSDDSMAYQRLTDWISQGAKRLPSVRCVSLTIAMDQEIGARESRSSSLRAIAEFEDGSREDVTPWTMFVADDPASLSIETNPSHVTVYRGGQHVFVARFLDHVVAKQITVPLKTNVRSPRLTDGFENRAIERSTRATHNWIDDEVNALLDRLELPSAPPTEDAAFARRVFLDLIGRIPSEIELERFLNEDSSDEKSSDEKSDGKRQRLVQLLLSNDRFADYWALKWANALGVDSKKLQPQGAEALQSWLAQRFRSDAPYNQTVNELLTATGDSYQVGAANFCRLGSSPGETAEQASKLFMGARMQCANCHNHPTDKWRQDDYHGLSAIFATVSRGQIVRTIDGEVTDPVTGDAAIPCLPGNAPLDPDSDLRNAFGDWVTDAANPYFAKATVNRIWSELMGRGLVEPIDDMRATNPATHPELLDRLAKFFVDQDFKIKPVVALICNSAAYQRGRFGGLGQVEGQVQVEGQAASHEAVEDTKYYSVANARTLEAEVIADMIASVTAIPVEVNGFTHSSLLQLTDNRLESSELDILGRCDRSEPCAASPGADRLATALHLINGDLLNRRLASDHGWLSKAVEVESDNATLIANIYRRLYTRDPTPIELNYWRTMIEQANPSGDPTERMHLFQDLVWGMLTSPAFITNR